ncbi:MAG: hypothetical protein NC121_04845 [Blautia sp.]|nr:hypothetical protein [Blautia sp.]
MSKFECKNCGFIVEQATQPGSCPLCGGTEFTASGSTQADAAANRSARASVPVGTVTDRPVREANPAPSVPRNSYVQFREFPSVQRDRVKKELEEKINAIQEEAAAYIGRQEAKNKKKNDSASGGLFGLVFGLVGFVGTCSGSCYIIDTPGFQGFLQVLYASLFVGIVLGVGMLFLGDALTGAKKKDYEVIDIKNDSAEEEKKSSQEAARRSISEYVQSFDRAVKESVQRFISSKTTEDIGNRILEGFLTAIGNAPRDARRMDIVVKCQYSVYANQVQYGGGIFSFSQNHCSNLAGPVEQAALGQAIATYLEVHVLEKYDRDPCGSVPQILIDNEDDAASRTVTVTYKAVNVYYRGA